MKWQAAAVVVVVVGVILLLLFDPRTAGFFPPCPLYLLTGLQCPGCGTTRALHALVHGDVAAAVDLNPFTMTLALVGVIKLLTPPLPRALVVPIAVAVVLAAVVFAVARNLA
jgi:hypothetical protein